MSNKWWVVVLGLGLAGCGGSDSNSGVVAKKGTVSAQGTQSVVTDTRALVTALNASDGAGLSGHVNSIAVGGAQRIVSPGAGLSGAPLAPAEEPTGSVSCDTSGCTYNQYSVGGFTYNGSVQATDEGGGKKIVADLTIVGSASSGSGSVRDLNWHITGTLTVTPTSINGSLASTGTGTAEGASAGGPSTLNYSYENLVQYNSVTLDGSGTPTGGSVYARWSIAIQGLPQGNQAWEGTVTFPM